MVTLATGKSAATMLLNVGAAALPLVGPANTLLAFWVFQEPVKVPLVVTGLPEIVNSLVGKDNSTDVTVPLPPPLGKFQLVPLMVKDLASVAPETVVAEALIVGMLGLSSKSL